MAVSICHHCRRRGSARTHWDAARRRWRCEAPPVRMAATVCRCGTEQQRPVTQVGTTCTACASEIFDRDAVLDLTGQAASPHWVAARCGCREVAAWLVRRGDVGTRCSRCGRCYEAVRPALAALS